jgi:hypothetical protein
MLRGGVGTKGALVGLSGPRKPLVTP